MAKFCLKIYELFNACVLDHGEESETNSHYLVVDENGTPCAQARVDHKNQTLVLKFVKQ